MEGKRKRRKRVYVLMNVKKIRLPLSLSLSLECDSRDAFNVLGQVALEMAEQVQTKSTKVENSPRDKLMLLAPHPLSPRGELRIRDQSGKFLMRLDGMNWPRKRSNYVLISPVFPSLYYSLSLSHYAHVSTAFYDYMPGTKRSASSAVRERKREREREIRRAANCTEVIRDDTKSKLRFNPAGVRGGTLTSPPKSLGSPSPLPHHCR